MNQYLKFIDRAQKIHEELELNYFEIKLLDYAALAHFSDQSIIVRDLISQAHIASQATLHKTVKNLVNKKLLIATMNNEDGRHKNVLLTRLALDRYKKLHQAIKWATSI